MRVFIGAFVFLATVSAQEVTKGSWENVERLSARSSVRVDDFNGREYKARLASVTSGVVVLDSDTGPVTLQRSEVRQVRARKVSGRARNAGIGAAIGGGIGLGIAGVLLAMTGGSDLTGPILAVFTAVGGAVGFGLGWIPPAYVTLYRARR